MMFSRMFAFFRAQMVMYARTKIGLFISLAFPLMMIFVFGSIQTKDYLEQVIPGLIGFSILTDSLFTVTGMTARDRMLNIFGQLALTPLKKSEWLFSVFLWHLIMAFAAFLVIAGVGHFAFSVNISLSAWIPLFIVFGTLLFVSLGLLIGTVAKSVESSSLISNVIGFPMMMLTGTFFPIVLLPEYLQTGVKVLPLYYFVQGLNNFMISHDTAAGIINLSVLAILSAVFFLLAIKLFKWRSSH